MTARDLDARIPLIVRVPGIEGGITESIVETTDIFPTLVELCGLPVIEGLDGLSFGGTIDDPKHAARGAALTQTCRPWPSNGEIEQMGYSLRTERWRYSQWINWRTKELMAEELYDHSSDPLELQNLNGVPEFEVILERIRKLMDVERQGKESSMAVDD